jgi:integrase/recombinase XerD
MADEDSRMLIEAMRDYSAWVKSRRERRGGQSPLYPKCILADFVIYIIHQGTLWEKMFTFETFEAFKAQSGYRGAFTAIRALSHYLFEHGRIVQPLKIPKPHNPLPDIYEHYLRYLAQTRQSSSIYLNNNRRTLRVLHRYLEKHHIGLETLKIDHLDAFMATFEVSDRTRSLYRYAVRGFLNYLYQERKLIQRNLAPLLTGPPIFAQSNLPKFLRPTQVKDLFDSLKLSTSIEIRTYATIHLAYSLGLRPGEISRITLDDISFQRQELTLRQRKGGDSLTLPIPPITTKAIALYLTKARPQSPRRHLFLTQQFPHHPVSSHSLAGDISKAMKQAGLPSTTYWLRHTYAQSLLHMGRSIYEVKEMMGHQNIQATQTYLQINVELMRKVLFDEKL